MSKNYNVMAFTPEEVKAGLFQKFLNTLVDYNSNCEKHYCDIHITTDGYCTILEWDCAPYTREWGGTFRHVDFNDEFVTHNINLPDGTCMRSDSEQEDREIIEDFMKDHPEYSYNWVSQEWNK